MSGTNRKNKKYCLFCLFIMILSLGINKVSAHQYINYYGIEMSSEEYLTLLNLGFTDDEIYYMDEDTFDENKDLDAELITKGVRYYKTVYPIYGSSYTVEITENEYFNNSNNQLLSTVTTQYTNEISTISANGSKYRYKNTISWLNIPDNKSYDIIAIGFINSVYIDSLVYYKHSYADSSGTWHNSTLYYDKKNTSTGGSVVYKIPSELYGLSAMIYFDVSKNTTDTLTQIAMCGDYAHSYESVTQYQAANHAINSGGIQLDASVYNLFNEVPCALEIANVNW